MPAEKTEALANLLVEARQAGRRVGAVPAAIVPQSDAEAYAVQDAVVRRLGTEVAGWKVGSPDATTEPNCSPLFAGLVRPSPARFAATADGMRAVEAELALKLGRDLPPREQPYSEDEAWAAVASLHAAIEFLDTRYADRRSLPFAAALADNLSNAGFTYGAPIEAWQSIDFSTVPVSLLVNGKEEKSAAGGNPAGHPRRLLAWLANHCASRGRMLRAGNIVTTGSHTGITVAPLGAMVEARFPGLGDARAVLEGV